MSFIRYDKKTMLSINGRHPANSIIFIYFTYGKHDQTCILMNDPWCSTSGSSYLLRDHIEIIVINNYCQNSDFIALAYFRKIYAKTTK